MSEEMEFASKEMNQKSTNVSALRKNETTIYTALEKWENIKQKWPNIFKEFTNHDVENFTSLDSFIKWMHVPTDAASIGIGRMLFGLCMLIDIPEERGGGNLDLRFGDPKDCHFPLFDFLQPLPLPQMSIVYFIMWMGALGITLGYKFRISCLMFVIPYWYVFFLDKTAWNNHSYLYGLCGLLFLFTNSHKYCSLDYRDLRKDEQKVPFWNYFLLKYQFFILYFVAGLKKMSTEWLSGYAMTNLGFHWVFAPFRIFLGVSMTELLVIHWFGATFDLTIAYFLIYEKTRVLATPFAISFHLMNSRLFTIGMFPWVCLAELPLFYKVDWPRTLWKKISPFPMVKLKVEDDYENVCFTKHDANVKISTNSDQEIRKRNKFPSKQTIESNQTTGEKIVESPHNHQINCKKKLTIFLIFVYCFVQGFLPYSHFITKGYNNWTNGIYGYSWDMMVHSYDTILTTVKIVDNNNNETHFMDPYAFTSYDRWTKHADMAVQYAKCIKKNILDDFKYNPNTILTSSNISIYFDIWCSMNGRFQQRVFNPKTDLLKAKWEPFESTEWVLPLLQQLSAMRPKLDEILEHVLSWNNHSDAMFIADFPDLTMENYIAPDLDNVSLTVLDGAIRFENDDAENTQSLSTGQRLSIKPGEFHRVTTVGSSPSCYMYTYINKTMQDLNIAIDVENFSQGPMLPLWNEFMDRFENYKNFFILVGNAFMFLVYGVPMPRRIREVS